MQKVSGTEKKMEITMLCKLDRGYYGIILTSPAVRSPSKNEGCITLGDNFALNSRKLGVSQKIRGTFLGGPCNKAYSI